MTDDTADGSIFHSVNADNSDIKEITVDGSVAWRAVEIIDDFEDGNATGWTIGDTSSGSSEAIVSPGLDGSNNAWEWDGEFEAHLAGADAVDRGPQPGDVFEVWFQIGSSSSTALSRFEFSADGNSDPDKYRIEWEAGSISNKTVSIEKYSGGSVTKVDTASFAPTDGTTYRCEIRWNAGNNLVEAQMYDAGGSSASSAFSITDDSSASGSEYTQPGIQMWANANMTNYQWDEFKIPQ